MSKKKNKINSKFAKMNIDNNSSELRMLQTPVLLPESERSDCLEKALREEEGELEGVEEGKEEESDMENGGKGEERMQLLEYRAEDEEDLNLLRAREEEKKRRAEEETNQSSRPTTRREKTLIFYRIVLLLIFLFFIVAVPMIITYAAYNDDERIVDLQDVSPYSEISINVDICRIHAHTDSSLQSNSYLVLYSASFKMPLNSKHPLKEVSVLMNLDISFKIIMIKLKPVFLMSIFLRKMLPRLK